MFTIQDLTNGKCAVINDGTLDELKEVLNLAFPKATLQPNGSQNTYTKWKNRSDWIGSAPGITLRK